MICDPTGMWPNWHVITEHKIGYFRMFIEITLQTSQLPRDRVSGHFPDHHNGNHWIAIAVIDSSKYPVEILFRGMTTVQLSQK